MVELCGDSVRRIREERGLTQLYVAKVVGVTTDTISRWENNRYPSIKRANALLLAEALDADLEQLIQPAESIQPEMSDENEVVQAESAGNRARVVIGASILLLLLVVLGFMFQSQPKLSPPMVVAHRELPNYAAPNSILPVILHLDEGLVGKGFILREKFPVGWKLKEANPPPSSLDNMQGMARWIIKPGETRKLIVYVLYVADPKEPDSESVGFHGEVVLKGNAANQPSIIDGVDAVKIAHFIWADQNGDNRVDDAEMLDASDVVDTMSGVHLNWDLLEKIWDAGGYLWSPEQKAFMPDHPPAGATLWYADPATDLSRAVAGGAIDSSRP